MKDVAVITGIMATAKRQAKPSFTEPGSHAGAISGARLHGESSVTYWQP